MITLLLKLRIVNVIFGNFYKISFFFLETTKIIADKIIHIAEAKYPLPPNIKPIVPKTRKHKSANFIFFTQNTSNLLQYNCCVTLKNIIPLDTIFTNS